MTRVATLGEFARLHLIAKAESGKFTTTWLAAVEAYLDRSLAHFGGTRDLASIGVADVRALVAHLQRLPNRRGGTMSAGNVRHHLNVLSGVYARAASEGYVAPGYNPVAALMEKPVGQPQEAKWLEVPEAALLLDAARTYPAPEAGTPFAYPLLATFLLTGGRETEVFGLELDDVSFERCTVTFRPNRWRRLKTRGSHRVVPLWPQLAEILREYLKGPHRPTGDLLFPSLATGSEALLTDVRKLLDHVAVRAGFLTPVLRPDGRPVRKGGWPVYEGRQVRTKMFRHTYCAARLQSLDQGAPVSVYAVSRELGHGSTRMVERVYAHLGTTRHRAEVVEFRADQHREQVDQLLAGLSRGVVRGVSAGERAPAQASEGES